MSILDLNLIQTYHLSSIGFADISQYDSTPTNASLEITVPGYNKSNVTFVPRAVNIYTWSTLNLDCTDDTLPLPDGLYSLRYSVYPNSTTWIEKTFMRTSLIEAKFKRIFLSMNLDCECDQGLSNKQRDKLDDIEILIQGSIAAANDCDVDIAYKLYKKAASMLDKLKICECN